MRKLSVVKYVRKRKCWLVWKIFWINIFIYSNFADLLELQTKKNYYGVIIFVFFLFLLIIHYIRSPYYNASVLRLYIYVRIHYKIIQTEIDRRLIHKHIYKYFIISHSCEMSHFVLFVRYKIFVAFTIFCLHKRKYIQFENT